MSYETDYFAWTREQAAHLRTLASLRVNLPVALDLGLLADELEEMGDNTIDVVEGLIGQILVHLLKLEWSVEVYPRPHWRVEILAWRDRVNRKLARSPTLRHRIDLVDRYRFARRQVQELLLRSHAKQVPADCPYALDDVLADGFFPANRHGIEN